MHMFVWAGKLCVYVFRVNQFTVETCVHTLTINKLLTLQSANPSATTNTNKHMHTTTQFWHPTLTGQPYYEDFYVRCLFFVICSKLRFTDCQQLWQNTKLSLRSWGNLWYMLLWDRRWIATCLDNKYVLFYSKLIMHFILSTRGHCCS